MAKIKVFKSESTLIMVDYRNIKKISSATDGYVTQYIDLMQTYELEH